MLGKSVTKSGELPKGEHWAVLEYTSVSVPGYDRGDPPETQSMVNYITFTSKEEMEEWVLSATTGLYSRKQFSVILAQPAIIETNVSIKVKT